MEDKMEKKIRETIHAINNLMAVTLLSAESLQRELEGKITREQKKSLSGIIKNEKKCAQALKALRQRLLG